MVSHVKTLFNGRTSSPSLTSVKGTILLIRRDLESLRISFNRVLRHYFNVRVNDRIIQRILQFARDIVTRKEKIINDYLSEVFVIIGKKPYLYSKAVRMLVKWLITQSRFIIADYERRCVSVYKKNGRYVTDEI